MSTPEKELRAWTISDAAETYQLAAWGGGSFAISERGELLIQPNGSDGPRFSLPELVQDLPAGGRRLLQSADGYDFTLVGGQITREHGADTGARGP